MCALINHVHIGTLLNIDVYIYVYITIIMLKDSNTYKILSFFIHSIKVNFDYVQGKFEKISK